jgi:osomolarity two-component system response regulator SKN7
MKLEVDVAKNGEEAYNKYQQNKAAYDFILTDIEMPILNGHEMAAKIRTTNKDICIITMTAHTAPEAYEQYKEYGINTVITKPFKKEDIIRVFAECSMAALNSKTKNEENYYLSNNN